MADYDPHPREAGPALVTEGPADAPTVLVLDPAGVAKHQDIPPSWRPLTRRRHVFWCRMPVMDAAADAGRVLDELGHRDTVVDVVTTGPAAEAAMDFALAHSAFVRSVLLVDPAAHDDRFATEKADMADALWQERSGSRIAELEQADVIVRVIAHSAGGSRDRIDPPLPLGHPDLVHVLGGVLDELDAQAAARENPRR